jgi:hypothetical protein
MARTIIDSVGVNSEPWVNKIQVGNTLFTEDTLGTQVSPVQSVAGRTGTVTLTKTDVGLGNVDNTADVNKPISTATQAALDAKQAALGYTAENAANKGATNGYAGLDGTGKVPAAQLPSYVDDVLEYANLAAFPGTGETGKIYVAIDTGKVYRWSGSAYVEISPSPGSTDAVPEGSVNLYHTTGRAAAAAPVQSVAGRTGTVTLTKSDVGLANVDNTADASKSFTATQISNSTTAGRTLLTAADATAQRSALGLGTAATLNVGTSANNVVQLDGSAKLPAIDGSQLTGLSGGGTQWTTGVGLIHYSTGGIAVGSTGGDFGGTWRGVFRHDQNAQTQVGVINSNTGAGAIASYNQITGTGNSFRVDGLHDNSGAPYTLDEVGSAVTARYYRGPYFGFQTIVGSEYFYILPGEVSFNGAVSYKTIVYRTNNIPRFQVGVNNEAESGSNAGTNYFCSVFNDAGSYIGTPLFIERATARVVLPFFETSPTATTFFRAPTSVTPATADNTTLLATTAHVQAKIGLATSQFIAAFYGVAAGNSAATNTTALNSCIAAAVAAGGGVVLLPTGTIALNALATIAGNGVVLRGQGAFGGTTLSFANATGDCIPFSTNGRMGIEDVYITASVRRTAGFAIKFSGSCFTPFVKNVRIDYHWNGVWFENGSDHCARDLIMRYMLGTYGVLLGGGSGGLYGVTLQQITADNPYPVAIAGRRTWASTTAYSTGDILVSNNGIWQCVSGGTSGASAPSTIPGSGPSDWTTTNYTTGSTSWRWVCHADLRWVTQDSYAYSLRMWACDLLNGAYGFQQADGANTGSSYPVWAYLFDVECDHSYYNNVLLDKGENFTAVGCWFGSCLTGNGVSVSGTHRGEVNISKTRIVGCWQHGILLNSGPKSTLIEGNYIGLNSQASAGTYHGITVGIGGSNFTIVNNNIGYIPTGSGAQGYGVSVGSGSSDYYVITNNMLRGNATGAISDGGSGSNKQVGTNV